MKISLDWINNYVDLSDRGIDEISHALTMVGFEVEGIETSGLSALDAVVVGRIDSYEGHPNADRLSVCQVDVGDGALRNIVCGAKNFKAGDHVLAALPGAVLPGDFKIKKSKLRGVVSEGMLCSERELGVGEDHAGIAILPNEPSLGTPVNELYPEPDTIFDVEVTPNRPDALSHIGIARELAAWFDRELVYPEIGINTGDVPSGQLVESVRCEDDTLCPHYRGYNIRNVQIAESPDWLKRRLRAVGLRPINNVVDITNFVLLETGQPLHAFDVAKIRGRQIIIRSAGEKEKIITLDDKERILNRANLVIADAERSLVVAGVMGSVEAEVDASSESIFLEAAYFNPVSVRRTSKQLNLSTDSSYRFERGVDPRGAEYAALRCIDLILQLAGGELLGPPLVEGEPPMMEREIEIEPDWIRSRLGFEITDEAIAGYLRRLELDVRETETEIGKPLFRVGIPSFRLDLYRRVDLVEEVIRMYGSDRIPEGEVHARATLRDDDPVPVYLRKASDILVGQGFEEVVHYTLKDDAEIRTWFGHEQGDHLRIANPLSADASHLRPSLVPGLLDCLKLNNARLNDVRRIFETGRVFREEDGALREVVSIGFAIQHSGETDWLSRENPDYYTTQRLVLDLIEATGSGLREEAIMAIEDETAWQEGHAGQIVWADGLCVAKFGLLSLEMIGNWDLEQPVLAGALYLDPEVFDKPAERKTFSQISPYPPSLRDLAIVTGRDEPVGPVARRLAEIADQAAGDDVIIESIRPFDVYRGKGLAEDEQSVAFQFVFRSMERTLKDKQVNSVFTAIQEAVDAEADLRIRR